MRNMPTAEANVVANSVFGDALKSMIEGLNAQAGPLAVLFRTLLDIVIVHVGEHSVVYLHNHAGLVNGAVFLTQGVRDGVDVVFFRGIVFVDAVVGGTGRSDDRKERFFDVDRFQRGLQVANIAIDIGVVAIFDRSDAGFGRHAF